MTIETLETTETWTRTRFEIECIKKCTTPQGLAGENWYQYIVDQEGSKITGYKSGTLKSVTEHVEEFIAGLNQRAAKGYSPYAQTTRSRKN
jgi:hypothetical protein